MAARKDKEKDGSKSHRNKVKLALGGKQKMKASGGKKTTDGVEKPKNRKENASVSDKEKVKKKSTPKPVTSNSSRPSTSTSAASVGKPAATASGNRSSTTKSRRSRRPGKPRRNSDDSESETDQGWSIDTLTVNVFFFFGNCLCS